MYDAQMVHASMVQTFLVMEGQTKKAILGVGYILCLFGDKAGFPLKGHPLFLKISYSVHFITLLVVKGNKLCRSSSLFANQKKYGRPWLGAIFES